MLKKYYTAELISRKDGVGDIEIIGSRIVAIWKWQSPVEAYNMMLESRMSPINFRKIS